MDQTIKNKIKHSIGVIVAYFPKIISLIVGLIAIITYMESKNIQIISFTNTAIKNTAQLLGLQDIPLFIWIISVLFFSYLILLAKKLNAVAGEFTDNFDRGLYKWDFGGEGWKTEYENGKPILSVSESGSGGISQKGFGWTDYEFTFDVKVINKNVGWIIRAENRTKYVMIQLNFDNPTQPLLRLHFRIPGHRGYEWIVAQETPINLKQTIHLREWIHTRIVNSGSNIDVYLNDEFAMHYFIADPIRFHERVQVIESSDKKKELKPDPVILNYLAGKVGFRCFGDEHAHIKNILVKPIL